MPWPLREFYLRRLKAEKGQVWIKDWGGRLRVALVYPNTYHVGMSNLGFQTVYGLLNRLGHVLCERCFLPDEDELKLLKQHHSPLLSLESQRPLKDFDLIIFSISFENDYLNVIRILDLSGIPLLSSERDENWPFVGAGGVATWLNPEPLASFMDFFLIGEAEGLLDKFVTSFLKHDLPKPQRLNAIAREVPGVYYPEGYQVVYNQNGTIKEYRPIADLPFPIIKNRAADFDTAPSFSQIVTANTEFSEMFLVEIERGCFHGCRFCGAGFIYRPPRFRSLSSLIKIIAQGLKISSKIGLIAGAVNDYPHIKKVLEFIINHQGRFSLSSLRADRLDEDFLQLLRIVGAQTITIAPEAGTQRLRNVINKGLSEDQILKAASLIAEAGFKTLKLYFIVGLPTETWEDLEAIALLIKKIKRTMLNVYQGRFCPQLSLSAASFVPKPFTPFQWHPMEDVATLKQKIRWLQKAFKKERYVRVNTDLPKWAYVQALLARGDRRVASLLLDAYKQSWLKALKSSPINPDFFVLRPREANEKFPWEVISHGIKREFLYQEYLKALRGGKGPTCPMKPGCNLCGVCQG